VKSSLSVTDLEIRNLVPSLRQIPTRIRLTNRRGIRGRRVDEEIRSAATLSTSRTGAPLQNVVDPTCRKRTFADNALNDVLAASAIQISGDKRRSLAQKLPTLVKKSERLVVGDCRWKERELGARPTNRLLGLV